MESLGNITLDVSDLYLKNRTFNSDSAISLARHFMKAGLSTEIRLDMESEDDGINAESIFSAIVASFNAAHGLELFMKIVLNAAGEKTSSDHNIKSLYYSLERMEPKLSGNFEKVLKSMSQHGVTDTRKTTLDILQRNYTKMRYFLTGDNTKLTLADRSGVFVICLCLIGTFSPGNFKAFLEHFPAEQ